MAATSTVPALFAGLRDRMRARLDAAGEGAVAFYSAPMGDDAALEAFTLIGAGVDQDWATIGGLQIEESYVVRGDLVVILPGAGEGAATAARDRAYALLAHLETELRADRGVGGAVRLARLIRQDFRQGSSPAGRGAVIDFTLGIQTRLRP